MLDEESSFKLTILLRGCCLCPNIYPVASWMMLSMFEQSLLRCRFRAFAC